MSIEDDIRDWENFASNVRERAGVEPRISDDCQKMAACADTIASSLKTLRDMSMRCLCEACYPVKH